jgi:NodT family efflux transporter outer membrane factor (OMF) lipoprotein
VARDYIDLRGAQLRERIANDNLKSAQNALELTQQRASGGLTTDLDVANAAAQVSNTAAEIPAIQRDEASYINALSLLLGQPPNALRAELEQPKPVPPVPPRVPVGVPSELARRRPDIRQAEAELHEATANIGVAVANFYPSVTLGGSVGIQALQASNLWTLASRQYSLGPSISIPIFEGGQLKSTLQLNKASEQEAAVNYQRTVLRAWHDIDNALTAYETTQRRRDDLVKAAAENQRALSLATERYQDGVADFLQVLDAQTRLLDTQQQLAIATTNVSENLVALYKALGGGWS